MREKRIVVCDSHNVSMHNTTCKFICIKWQIFIEFPTNFHASKRNIFQLGWQREKKMDFKTFSSRRERFSMSFTWYIFWLVSPSWVWWNFPFFVLDFKRKSNSRYKLYRGNYFFTCLTSNNKDVRDLHFAALSYFLLRIPFLIEKYE